MEKHPIFSIGIPVYNAEKYLANCINSIRAQSFEDYELILVDDGSTDDSLDICRYFEEIDSRIKVFHKENSGISETSNFILQKCRGDYIFLMDNDDLMYDNALDNAFRFIEKNEYPDVLFCTYLQQRGSIQKEGIYPENVNLLYENNIDTLVGELFAAGKLLFPLWGKFVKRIFWENSNVIFNSAYNSAQDAAVTISLIRKTKSIVFEKFYSIIWFHPRENSVSTSWKARTIINTMTFYRDFLKDINDWDITNELKRKIQSRVVKTIKSYCIESFSMPKEDKNIVFEFIADNFDDIIKNTPIDIDRYMLIHLACKMMGTKTVIKLLLR